jgi:biotin carboxylase
MAGVQVEFLRFWRQSLKNNTGWIICLPAGKWQIPGIRRINDLGLKVIGIDGDSKSQAIPFCDIWLTLDINDSEKVLAEIKNLDVDIAGAISFNSDAGIEICATIEELFVNDPKDQFSANCLVDKSVQRKIWDKAGIDGPRWITCFPDDFNFEDIKEFKFPVVIKPTISSGSRGVKIVEKSIGIEDLKNASLHSKNNKIIIEEFCFGIEYTVDSFFLNGINHILMITEKFKTLNNTKTVSNKLVTVDSNFKHINKIREILTLAYFEAGYLNGPAHAEIIIDNLGNLRIVEIAGRSGGFLISDKMIPIVSGVDVLKLTILQKMSRLKIFPTVSNKPAILYFFPTIQGKLLEIKGIVENSFLEGVFIQQFIPIGTEMSAPVSDGDRILAILVSGESLAETEIKLNQVIKNIEVVVK